MKKFMELQKKNHRKEEEKDNRQYRIFKFVNLNVLIFNTKCFECKSLILRR